MSAGILLAANADGDAVKLSITVAALAAAMVMTFFCSLSRIG